MKNLKEALFYRTAAELSLYLYMKKGGYTENEIEKQRERFASAYQIIEDAELEDGYQAWKAQYADVFGFKTL